MVLEFEEWIIQVIRLILCVQLPVLCEIFVYFPLNSVKYRIIYSYFKELYVLTIYFELILFSTNNFVSFA